MNSLQYYKDRYREIAENLNFRGDAAELLIQLLANASYIEEVENISYMEEASLENATLMNSKIQRCMDMMYSVYRGTCPRVILRFKPTKEAFSANPYDEIATSSNFRVYYLAYLGENYVEGSDYGYDAGFRYSSVSVNPGKEVTILGFISPGSYEYTGDNAFKIADYRDQVYINSYKLDVLENLSSDVLINSTTHSNLSGVTRDFSDHVLNNKIFDLTTPNFGSRLYFKGILDTNDSLEVTYFSMCKLSDFQENELKKISIRNTAPSPFTDEGRFIVSRGLTHYLQDQSKGLIVVPGSAREGSAEVHYNANKFRYTNTIFRSNTDLGRLLEEDFPDKVVAGGTVWTFNDGNTTIYYIPRDEGKLLNMEEKDEFRGNRKAYYITDNLNIERATKVNVVLSFEISLYRASTTLEGEISKLIDTYKNKFGINFANFSKEGNELKAEMISTISKLSEVKYVQDIKVSLADSSSYFGTLEDIYSEGQEEATRSIYYDISYQINTKID